MAINYESIEDKRSAFLQARALLEGFFPDIFNFKKPKPLKVGIHLDLFELCKKKALPFTEQDIHLSLYFYVENIRYLKALVTYQHRYDLKGNKCELIDKDQRNFAKFKIRKFFKKKALKAANAGDRTVIQENSDQ